MASAVAVVIERTLEIIRRESYDVGPSNSVALCERNLVHPKSRNISIAVHACMVPTTRNPIKTSTQIISHVILGRGKLTPARRRPLVCLSRSLDKPNKERQSGGYSKKSTTHHCTFLQIVVTQYSTRCCSRGDALEFLFCIVFRGVSCVAFVLGKYI